MSIRLRLDRSRYHSTVHGDISDNVHFRQDGLPFDGAGHLVMTSLTNEQRDQAEKKLAALNAAAAPAPEQQASQTSEGEGVGEGEGGAVSSATGDAVNLEAWLRGEVKYQPHVVFATIRERYSKIVSNFAESVFFLVDEQKVVAPADLGPGMQKHYNAA